MKTLSRRKFVERAVMSGAGVTVLSGIAKPEDIMLPQAIEIPESHAGAIMNSDKEFHSRNSDQNPTQHDFSTMRPVRKIRPVTVTVGQDAGDLQGKDDKILQAAVDYVAGLGGGTVLILPGVFTMHNSLFPRRGITIRGSGEKTILRKCSSVSSKIVREADWYEYCVQVENPDGFTEGGGIALSTDKKNDQEARLYTITAMEGNVLFLDKRTEKNYWMMEEARASTRFSIIHALNVDDVHIEDIALDGNREENERINDNYAGAVFMQYCNNWTFKNVTARNYNGDGFSFQVCDDIHFEDCASINNADLGFHPGSGSQRPVFNRCTARGNSQGFFWCWGACFGEAEDCIAAENKLYGVNFGHRDTDNILRNCLIENNDEIGILFRKEENEYRTGDRNIIERCTIRDNGKAGPGLGIDIQWKTKDISIRDCHFENTNDGPQKTGIRISAEAKSIILEKNRFSGNAIRVDDSRPEI